MKITFNPSTVAALTTPPNNKDITFDLRGRNIFARGVKFYGTDTNTWRDIKINNVSIGSHTLDLQNGSNTTLTNTNGVVTINSTWRPVVDNLTSDSTTSSLSAKQGKVLKALIDGKSNSDHNHDDRYLRLTGGRMSGDINFTGDNKIYWDRNTDSASISFKNKGDDDADSYMSFVTSDNGNEYFRWSHRRSGSTDTEWMALRSDGLRVRGTKVSLEGHTHDDRYYTKAESNAKYITDITTSVNKLTFTRNGSNIIRDITVNVVHSQGRLTDIPNKDATTKASPGLLIYDSYNQTIGTNTYSSVLSINTGGTIQIAGNWGDDDARNLYWRSQSDKNVANYPWKSWRTILDSENYSSTLDSRYYTESEVNSLLNAKLNRQNLSYGDWNPRGWNLAADYYYNGGDLSISENNGKMYVSIDGCFWQNEGQYRVLDTSDIVNIRNGVTLHQYLEATDADWYPLVWGGNAHNNSSDSTGAVYKSYDKLSWQNSSQTLYTTHLKTTDITFPNSGTSMRGLQGIVGDNDVWRIKGGATASNSGYLEIAVADDGNEPIYVRQYLGNFSTIERTLTLLDNNGFTHFPGYINIGGNENNNSSPDRVWGSNSSDSYLRSYRTSALRVAYAGNADTLGGIPRNYGQAPFGTIPSIGNDGVMEIGRCIDFHYDNSGSYDYSTRIQVTGNHKNTINLPSESGTLALTSYGGTYTAPIFLGYLKLSNNHTGGIVSSSFSCLGFTVPFTYNVDGAFCKINIPNTSCQVFYIEAAFASIFCNDAWWLHCEAVYNNTVQLKGIHLLSNGKWENRNPLYSDDSELKIITVCLFGSASYT